MCRARVTAPGGTSRVVHPRAAVGTALPFPSARPPVRERVRRFLAEYGVVGVVVYLVIHAATFVGAWAAIRAGWHPRGTAGRAGAVMAAYLVTSVTKVPRLVLAMAATPFVARRWDRLRARWRGQRPTNAA